MSFITDLERKKERSTHWYSELGGLIAAAPDISVSPLPPSALIWVGRVNALLQEMGQHTIAHEFKHAFEYRSGSSLSSPQMEAEKLSTALYMALGLAERTAPSAARGTYIPVASAHDALLAIAPLLGQALTDVFIIDPYMSQVILNDFALSIREEVKLRLLSGKKRTSDDLEPALRAWREQRKTRPIEVRLAKQDLLHDRLIIADGNAWSLSQSFNMLAKRSPATLQPFEPELGRLKSTYYEDVWNGSQPM